MILTRYDGVVFEVPDEWWAAADMAAFERRRLAYRPQSHAMPIVLLSVERISVSARAQGVANFERARMLRVLAGIRFDQPLPPVEVEVDERPATGFTHRLYNGYHRFHASLAAGYSLVPAVIVDMG